MTTRASLFALAAVLVGCAAGPHETAVLDLVARFEYADVLAGTADLPFLLARPLLTHEGWLRDEWSEAGSPLWLQEAGGSLTVPLAAAADRELRIRARSNPAYGGRLQAQLYWNGASLGRLRLTPEEDEFRLRIPASLQRRGENVLRVECLKRQVRLRRPLAVSSLVVTDPQRGSDSRVPRRSARGLWLPPGTSIAYYVRHASQPGLRLLARAAEQGTTRLQAAVSDGARSVPLADVALAAGNARLVLETLPCEPHAVCRLEIASAGEGAAWIEELTLRLERPRPPASRAVPGRPNVIVFLVDAMRADFAGAYGHPAPTTPRFDAFAREALLFEDASAQSSWTRPAVASLLTGLDVGSHGVGGVTNMLVPEITTLAEAFRAAGYGTGAFVANGIVNRQLGYDQGFQAWNEGGRLDSKRATEVVDAALRWAASQDANRPFFLYVHTLDPHKPYQPAPEHHAPFLFAGYAGERNLSALIAKGRLEPDELRYLRSAYEGEVHQNDAAFGAFLDGLLRHGLLESSVIAFTADHGEEFLDHGGFGHGGTLYHELLHVPLAIRIPGARRGRRDPDPVAQIDVAPTLLALAGVPPPPEIQGRDLSSRCLGLATSPAELALLVSRLSYAAADKLAVRSGALKLIVNLERGLAEASRLELYDLEQDPAELHNIAGARPFAVRYLLAQAAQATDASRAVRTRLKAGREAPLTPEQLEQLNALGYVQ